MTVTARPLPRVELEQPRRGRPPGRNEILRAGKLGGHDPQALVARFGGPLYVYDLDVVSGQVTALRRILPARFGVAYALKANPALAVAEHLAGLGLGADVASGGELEAALRARFRRDRIVFTGPGKRDDELRRAVAVGVRAVTVESLGELARLERIAAQVGRRVPVLLRAAMSEAARLERVRLVGDDGAGKFGMDIAELPQAAGQATASPHLEWLGLHAFGASNVLAASDLARHVARTVALAREVAAEAGVPLRLVDVGGGLGIPYETHEESLDLVLLGRRLEELERAWSVDPAMDGVEVLIEPGRFLVGPAGAYVCRIVDVKAVADELVAITEGGINHLLRPALVGQEHRIRLFRSGGEGQGPVRPVRVAGPLCSGLDLLSDRAILPEPLTGDLLAVLDTGAYGFTESMALFLSHPTPAEIALKGGRAEMIRPPITPADVLEHQRQPLW